MAQIYTPPRTIEAISSFNEFAGNINNLGYQKISQTIEQFSNKAAYDAGEQFWVSIENTNGSVVFNPDQSTRTLQIGSGVSDVISSQTKQAFVYLSGNVHRFTNALLPNLQVGAGCEFGIFDDKNGCFLRIEREASGYKFYAVRRSNTTGTPVDYVVPQEDFNVDTLDGTGQSGVTIDVSKIQMWHVEFSWYGGGGIAYGCEIDRKIVHFHWEGAGNRLDEFIFGDPDLPCRFRLYNKQATAGNSQISLGGLFVGIDGSFFQRKGYRRSWLRPLLNVSNGNTYVLASLKPKPTFKGKINRSYLQLEEIFVFGTAVGYYYLVLNGSLTNTNWIDVNTQESTVMYDQSATSLTGGIVLYANGLSSDKGGNQTNTVETKDPLTNYSDGSGSDVISIVFVCTGNGNVATGFNWLEYY